MYLYYFDSFREEEKRGGGISTQHTTMYQFDRIYYGNHIDILCIQFVNISIILINFVKEKKGGGIKISTQYTTTY